MEWSQGHAPALAPPLHPSSQPRRFFFFFPIQPRPAHPRKEVRTCAVCYRQQGPSQGTKVPWWLLVWVFLVETSKSSFLSREALRIVTDAEIPARVSGGKVYSGGVYRGESRDPVRPVDAPRPFVPLSQPRRSRLTAPRLGDLRSSSSPLNERPEFQEEHTFHGVGLRWGKSRCPEAKEWTESGRTRL